MSVLLSSNTDEWLTPPDLLERVRAVAPIALDPCSSPLGFVGARESLDIRRGENGLSIPWAPVEDGLVWVNPPYSALGAWLAKCAREAEVGVPVLALVPLRGDTAAFHDHVWGKACLYVFRGRLAFHRSIEIEWEAEQAKAKPRPARLQAIEDAAYQGARTFPADSATFAACMVVPDGAGLRRTQELADAFPNGPEGRWIR